MLGNYQTNIDCKYYANVILKKEKYILKKHSATTIRGEENFDGLKDELEKCQALGGYMASANVVQSYLEKRVFALENAVKHEKRIEDSLDAFDG